MVPSRPPGVWAGVFLHDSVWYALGGDGAWVRFLAMGHQDAGLEAACAFMDRHGSPIAHKGSPWMDESPGEQQRTCFPTEGKCPQTRYEVSVLVTMEKAKAHIESIIRLYLDEVEVDARQPGEPRPIGRTKSRTNRQRGKRRTNRQRAKRRTNRQRTKSRTNRQRGKRRTKMQRAKSGMKTQRAKSGMKTQRAKSSTRK